MTSQPGLINWSQKKKKKQPAVTRLIATKRKETKSKELAAGLLNWTYKKNCEECQTFQGYDGQK